MVIPYIINSTAGDDKSPAEAAKYTPRDNSLFISCRVCGGTAVEPNTTETQPCSACKGTGAKRIR